MTRAAFVIPGDITLPTGGYAYDRRVLALLGAEGVACTHVALPGGYPNPSADDLAQTERRLAALPPDTVLLIDGLAYGAMPAEVITRLKQKIVALVHHPLCLEAGLTPMRQRYLQQTEQMALALAEHVVVTSSTTGRTLAADFGVVAGKVTVAEPGTERAPRARGTKHDAGTPLQLLAVGSIVPRKAYEVLIAALGSANITTPWHLTIVGAVRDEAARQRVEQALDDKRLRANVTIARDVDDARLADLYGRCDLFVMPSLYEGFGMVLTEAMARGLPIVCTTGGAAAETVPDAAAVKVPPGNAYELETALIKVMTDSALRQRMADASWAASRSLPTWNDTARTIAAVLKRVAT